MSSKVTIAFLHKVIGDDKTGGIKQNVGTLVLQSGLMTGHALHLDVLYLKMLIVNSICCI